MWFEAISRLKINPSISDIILVGRVDNVELLAVELGCGVGSLPTTCLGLPLGLLIGRWGFRILLKKDSERDWYIGRDCTSIRAGDHADSEYLV